MTNDISQDIVFVDEPIVDAQVLSPQGAPCTACGAPIEPGDRFCPHCGLEAEGVGSLIPHRVGRGAATGEAERDSRPLKHIECQSCGAKIKVDPDERSFTCPFCDSTYVVEHTEAATGRQPPEFVIGFAVTPEQALEKFRRWIRDNSFFRPGDLAQAKIEDKMRGVYLPFWRFTMRAASQWSATIGEYWYREETYYETDSKGNRVRKTRRVRETEWWPLSGRHHQYHRDYLVSGSQGLGQRDADSIKPFNLPALKRYEAWYIAGWITEEYSVEKDEALDICRQEFYRREQAAVAGFLPGDTHSELRVSTRFSHITSDLCLLPVYLLSYRYRDKVYRFLVNGQTGKISGNKPWSHQRIWAVVGVGLAIVAVIVLIIALIILLAGGQRPA